MSIRTIACLALLIGAPSLTKADSPTDTAKSSIQNYFQAWNTTDVAKRTELLKTAWSESGVYTDPSAHIEGRQALIEHISTTLASPQFQGASLAPASEIDMHHQVFRFQWKLVDGSGKTLFAGMDYGEFDDKGVITKIIGFFGPFPPLQE